MEKVIIFFLVMGVTLFTGCQPQYRNIDTIWEDLHAQPGFPFSEIPVSDYKIEDIIDYMGPLPYVKCVGGETGGIVAGKILGVHKEDRKLLVREYITHPKTFDTIVNYEDCEFID